MRLFHISIAFACCLLFTSSSARTCQEIKYFGPGYTGDNHENIAPQNVHTSWQDAKDFFDGNIHGADGECTGSHSGCYYAVSINEKTGQLVYIQAGCDSSHAHGKHCHKKDWSKLGFPKKSAMANAFWDFKPTAGTLNYETASA